VSDASNRSVGFAVRRMTAADAAEVRVHVVRVLRKDFGYEALDPRYHWDLADLQGAYVSHPRQALFAARDDATRAVIGTAAIREDGPHAPPHPRWLAERYRGPDCCHLLRVYVAREHRRRGVGRALVDAARRFAAGAGYRTIYLHTNAGVPGALAFWRAMPTTEVHDSRGQSAAEGGLARDAVHFELALPAAVRA
jgi:GNAT superfamily N-acetyltransferase